MSLRTRRFVPADEVELNLLYNQLRRGERPRSLDLMRWLWYYAPGGKADSWIVEAEQPDGSWRIVGHHGLCPVRFTHGEQDLFCAKTTSSLLLPEYRFKFLYLRFEQDCLQEADARFDATYSYAPGTARLRKPLGYASKSRWIHLVRGLHHPQAISRALGYLAGRSSQKACTTVANWIASVSSSPESKSAFELQEYISDAAAVAPFFAEFWKEARAVAGMAPRRDAEDLAWRFWNRPDSVYATLVHDSNSAKAYFIVNTTNALVFRLEDFFLVPSRPKLLDELLAALFQWCARKGALMLRFSTTDDGQPSALLNIFLRRMSPAPLRSLRPQMELPIRWSEQGREKLPQSGPWNATGFLLIG